MSDQAEEEPLDCEPEVDPYEEPYDTGEEVIPLAPVPLQPPPPGQLCPITLDGLDQDATKVVLRLMNHDYEAYLVGGCVRDLLLGRPPKDFDVATAATPSEIRKLFRNCRIIGRRFRLAHIFFGQKIIETATFRAKPSEEADNGDPLIWHDNEFGDAVEDAQRRDFTINGLFYDATTGKVIDHVDGLRDLRTRTVRTIGDPDVRMQEDPVRILRAIKFAARLDLNIEPATKSAMTEHRALLAECSAARVLEEIHRFLRSGTAKPFFELLHQYDVFGILFPEIASAIDPELEVNAVVRAGVRRRPRKPDDTRPPKPELSAESPDISEHQRLLLQLRDLTPEARAAREHELARRTFATLATETNQDLLENTAAMLGALDQHNNDPESAPSEALGLAALLSPLCEPLWRDQELRIGDIIQRVETFVEHIAQRLQVSRKHREQLKHLLIAQKRLAATRRQHGLRRRPYFGDAVALLRMRHQVAGDLEQSVEFWSKQPPVRSDRSSRSRPRRRRRKRRRSGDSRSE